MAAKVAMVAVPTVLGLASIQVYTVREGPTDGLVTRDKLNIYTPVPQSAPAQFVPEKPGVIQSGLTSTRETVQPFVQAVKGACVSVKTGSVNLYHAGEDVYYYLKDPPPGFLPRFGTITMAGLLGMFLARKGSHLKRVAVPMGLMSAGASVCYPAQAVAVLKVTGKKVYSVGQWSSAAVSSLFTSEPKEPGTKEAGDSQEAAVPVSESAAVSEASEASSVQSPSVPATEVKSAETVPVSEEPIEAVVKDEVSSVPITEISPDQVPTEANTDPEVLSVPAETQTTTVSEEIPAPVESELSDTNKAPEDVSAPVNSAEPAPSVEPETVEAAPVKSVPVESAPEESNPVESASVELTPVVPAPEESTSVQSAPVDSAPVEFVPADNAPVESVQEESTSAEAVPVESAPVESVPVESAPVESAPVESTPVEAAPVEAASIESASAESVPSSEEPPVSKASDDPLVPVIDSADSTSAAVEETQTPTEPAPQQPAGENVEEGSSFKPDPALMDFGQSSPEDDDLYSTRS